MVLARTLAIAAVTLAASCAHTASEPDARQRVRFPEEMRSHTLSNMRDHLQTLERISAALSRGDYDAAASLAEQRLGMTSLEAHGAAHLAQLMPPEMQQIGSRMHRAASRFAIEAQDAAVRNDPRPALGALSEVMQQCVACHAAYRLQ
jgi:cytochrome c556